MVSRITEGAQLMPTRKPLEVEISSELIRQYKDALAGLSDMRLIILLLFNSFEEIMKCFAAWRLSCHVDELPFKNNTHSLIEVILAGTTTKGLRRRIDKFSALRHTVAHKFHLNDYEQKLREFVKSNSNKPCPDTEPEKRKALIDAFCDLTLDIASHIDEIQPRGEWPFPFLSLELNAYRG